VVELVTPQVWDDRGTTEILPCLGEAVDVCDWEETWDYLPVHGLHLVSGTGISKQPDPLFSLGLDSEVKVVVILGLRYVEIYVESGRKNVVADIPDPEYISLQHREIGVQISPPKSLDLSHHISTLSSGL
jgi:hypothetical protein